MKAPYIPLAIVPFLIFSCGSPKDSGETKADVPGQTSTIQPIDGLELPIKTYTVSATEASTIELPNGGSIVIPANAFVDESGKPVSGKVDIAWQEFHSLSDIALSGIPMQYDSAGVSSDLISGGMFTIDGSQKNKPISIAPDKKVEVNLATRNPQKDMNFYALDEKSGKWAYKSAASAQPEPGAPVANDAPKAIPHEFMTLDVSAKIDKQKFPELNPDDILGWEINASELSKDDQKKIKSATCTADVASKSGKQYTLHIKNKYIEKNIPGRPVTFDNPPSKSDARKAIDDQVLEMNDYVALAEKGDLIRSISIPNFGTYNWDCMYKEPSIDADVTLDIPNTNGEDFATFFFVSPEKKRIIKIKSHDKIKVSALVPAFIIAITKRKEVFTVRDKQLDQIRQNKGERDFTFMMDQVPGKMDKPEDMERFMNRCK